MNRRARSRPRLGSGTAIWLLVILAGGLPVAALDPDKSFHQYRLDVWQPEDGLSQASVVAVVQTSDGYLWLGGYEGLARFDGVGFTVFDTANTPALRDNNIFDLEETADRSLWIGTDGGGLTRFAGGAFTTFTTADGLIDDQILVLAPGRDGSLWIGTRTGLSRFRDGRFVSYTTREGLPGEWVATLAEDRDGALWIGTQGGLARLEGGTITAFSGLGETPGNGISALGAERAGALWIGTYDGNLYRLENGVLALHARAAFAGNYAVRILQDRDGNLWFGTYGAGLYRLSSGRFTAFGPSDGLASDLVWDLFEDRQGNLWIATEGGGLSRLKDPPLVPLTRRDGLPHERVAVGLEDRDGDLWLGTDGAGLTKLEDGDFGSVEVYTMADGLASDVLTALHPRRDGGLWIGSDQGLDRMRDRRIAPVLAGDHVFAVLEDRRGRLWLGTRGGLLKLEDGRTTTFRISGSAVGDEVRVLAETRDGAIWIGANSGLAQFHNGELVTHPELAGPYVREIYEDSAGTLWIGTRGHGLTRLRGDDATTYTSRDGLFDDVIFRILEDGDGNLWMSCNKGLFRVAKDQLERFARGEIATVDSVSYGVADGMKTIEFMGGSQPAGWRTRDGKLWFPTPKGLVIVDPENYRRDAPPPPVYVERVVVDGTPLAGPGLGAGELTLPPGRGELEFHYTGLSLSDPERIRFRYKLVGYDHQWVEAGARRSAFYTNMPPGSYRFEVTARSHEGAWNDAGDAVDIRLRPDFYQTWWFYLIVAVAGALALRGAHHLRIRALMRRNRELHEIQTQLEAKTGEMERFTYAVSHDLKSPLLTVLGYLGLLEKNLTGDSRARAAADIERIRGAAEKMQEMLDELLELSQIGRVVQSPEPVDLGVLAHETVGLIAGRIAERGVEVAIAPDLPVVAGDRRRLLQMLQNLIDNAVKFMGGQETPRIEIGCAPTPDGGEAACYVRDNGVGIDAEHHRRIFGVFDRLDSGIEGVGMGLALVERIVELHGGRIWVESAGAGRGSSFCFILPLAAEPVPARSVTP